jgi:hypothetical protein
MQTEHITTQQSLSIIEQMIFQAKKEQKDDGKGWIIWGWMLFVVSLLTIINIEFRWFSTFLFWNIFGILAVLLGVYETICDLARKGSVKVRTYTGDLFAKLNVGFFISLLFIIVAMNVGIQTVSEKLGSFDGTFANIGFALLINLYAFWILIYGTALNFKPSVIAAFVTWGIGIGAIFLGSFQLVMVAHALAALIGYIIPGHIANSEFNKLRREEAGV